jgi:hypothetical protein
VSVKCNEQIPLNKTKVLDEKWTHNHVNAPKQLTLFKFAFLKNLKQKRLLEFTVCRSIHIFGGTESPNVIS